jgi:dephospho-CoA kinase
LPSGEIDRRALGRIIFADPGQKTWLENRLHPMVQTRVREIRQELAAKGDVMAFYEVPLLFEKNLQDQFDKVVVVWVSEAVQLERLRLRNAWSELEIQQRLQAQWPVSEKVRRADFTINNDGDLAELQAKVTDLIERLSKSI